MLNSVENQEIFLDENNRFNLDSLSDIFQDSFFCLNKNLSIISAGEFIDQYNLLCKKCWKIPILNFMESQEKIVFICECSNYSKKVLSIQEVFSYYLYDKFEDPDKNKLNLLKCKFHPDERYFYYCQDCEQNICNICLYENQNKCHHENKIVLNNDRNTINKIKYIKEKLQQMQKNYSNLENNNTMK